MELQHGCSCSKNSTSGKCNTRWKAKPIETWFKARCSQHPIVVLRSNDVLGLANLIQFPKRKRNKCTATPFPFWKTNQTACDKARTNANKSPSIQSHRPILCPWSEESACSCPCYQSIRGSETNQEIHSIHLNTLQTGTTGTLHQRPQAGFASNSATHRSLTRIRIIQGSQLVIGQVAWHQVTWQPHARNVAFQNPTMLER